MARSALVTVALTALLAACGTSSSDPSCHSLPRQAQEAAHHFVPLALRRLPAVHRYLLHDLDPVMHERDRVALRADIARLQDRLLRLKRLLRPSIPVQRFVAGYKAYQRAAVGVFSRTLSGKRALIRRGIETRAAATRAWRRSVGRYGEAGQRVDRYLFPGCV